MDVDVDVASTVEVLVEEEKVVEDDDDGDVPTVRTEHIS